MQIIDSDEQSPSASAERLHPTLPAATAMAVSISGFALFFYDALGEPSHAGLLMLLAWLLMVTAIGVALEALDREPDDQGRRDFAVGALRTTIALPLVIAYVVAMWLLLVFLQGGIG
jgi:hypothetical protein